MLVALVLRKRPDVRVLRRTSEATRRVALNTHRKTITKKRVIIGHVACVQTFPLPQKKIGRRDVLSSPDFFPREGGRLNTGYNA